MVSLGKTTQNLKRLLQQQAQEGSAGAAVTGALLEHYGSMHILLLQCACLLISTLHVANMVLPLY